MPVKDYLYKTLAIKLNIPSATIEKVMQHSFESAHGAMKKFNTVEIAGFGKFLFSLKKAKKRLEVLEIVRSKIKDKMVLETSEDKLKYYQSKLDGIKEDEDQLKIKVNV